LGQGEGQARTVFGIFRPDAATMGLDDAPAQREADPESARASREEGLEEAVQRLLRHA